MDDGELAMLIGELRGYGDFGEDLASTDPDACIRFWSALAQQTGSAYAQGCHADALMVAGRSDAAIAVYLEVFAAEPELFFELGDDAREAASKVGGAAWLGLRLAELRSQLAAATRGGDGDLVRELYSDLLEEVEPDSAAMAQVREVGHLIDEAVERGDLPRALVRRGKSRPQANG